MRGSWKPNRNCNILTLTLMAVMLCLSCSPSAQPEVQRPTLLGAGFLYCILSESSLDPNSSGPQAPSAWCGFTYYISSHSVSISATATQLFFWLRYIIVQRPFNRRLDLWNRMFNLHQAEITVMQFTGHSLPVRQSMRVSWDFLARPISSANFRPRYFLS